MSEPVIITIAIGVIIGVVLLLIEYRIFVPRDRAVVDDMEESSTVPWRISVVCPHCEEKYPVTLEPGASVYDWACHKAHESPFTFRVVTVLRVCSLPRSRVYRMRIANLDGSKDRIKLTSPTGERHTFRRGDLVVFSYIKNNLAIVQNLDTGTYIKLINNDCYVATYLYGPASEQVATLHRFRDHVLLRSAIFAFVVKLYYATSPILVKYLGPNRAFRVVALPLVNLVVKIARRYPDGELPT